MSIEAMKQALEALEFADDFIGMKPYEHVAEEAADGHRNLLEAITSLRQAIAEAEKQEPYGYLKLSNSKFYQEVEGVPNIKKSPDYLPLYTHPQPKAEKQVAFKIYKPTPPQGAIPNVRDAELPWVYDQDPSSGNVASMWVTPVKPHPQPKEAP